MDIPKNYLMSIIKDIPDINFLTEHRNEILFYGKSFKNKIFSLLMEGTVYKGKVSSESLYITILSEFFQHFIKHSKLLNLLINIKNIT
jgi:hypothetical protein